MSWGKNFILKMAFVAMGYLGSVFSNSAQLLAQSRPCDNPNNRPLYSMTQNNVGAQSALPTMDAHLALMYYTTADLSKSVADMTNSNDQPLVKDLGNQFLVWNVSTLKYDTLESGLRIYDQKTGYKGVFTYDKKNDVINIDNAGTNFSNKTEMFAAAKAMLNITPPAVKIASQYVDSGLNDLTQKNSEINKATTKINFYSHSVGGAVAVQEMAHVNQQGWQVGQSVFADPFYAGKMVNKITRNTSSDEKQIMKDFYNNTSMTMDPAKANFIDWMPPFNMGKNIGVTVNMDKKDNVGSSHDIHNYVGRQTTTPQTYVYAYTPKCR